MLEIYKVSYKKVVTIFLITLRFQQLLIQLSSLFYDSIRIDPEMPLGFLIL